MPRLLTRAQLVADEARARRKADKARELGRLQDAESWTRIADEYARLVLLRRDQDEGR